LKKTYFILIAIFFLGINLNQAQAYDDGEWLKFRMHYGLITAGYATLQVDEEVHKGKDVFHVKGVGKTTGITKFFFNVEDYYESYIDKELNIPYRFIRKIDEGGHTKDIQIDFDYQSQKALVFNKKHNRKSKVSFPKDVQDMVSAFYYLRNNMDVQNLNVGDETTMNMFFDKENFKFRLKFLGREILETDFGKVPCLIFRPYVQSGRVFKEQESLTLWVSDDENKIPILIEAELMVGSLKATLIEFKGLNNSFRIVSK